MVLSRHVNEQITIGDEIRVNVVRIEGGKVTLGIDAPAKLRIERRVWVKKEVSNDGKETQV